MKKELLEGLSEQQIAKIKECKNQEELLALAKQEGIQLTDEQLEAVSGGICTSTPTFVCPQCGSSNIKTKYNENSIAEWWNNTCQDCGKVWIVNK
jgi:transposase-like protein